MSTVCMSLRRFITMAKYENWSRQELIMRLNELDRQRGAPPPHTPGTFDFNAHPKRKIALKFCYAGWDYSGLAVQAKPTPLPTVEQVLFEALAHTRLVDAEVGFDGCGWERCGRTDRGVSAAGQVISLWVRSAFRPEGGKAPEVEIPEGVDGIEDAGDAVEGTPSNNIRPPTRKQEFYYVSMLNRILPDSIRVLAWSPVPGPWSCRYACRKRHYKYFFTSNGMNIDLMRDAASRLLGEHDFRNLCKLDPTKQITSFCRTILRADISQVEGDIHVFDLEGSAFLYHQVRHIMAVLFLIGSGLEHPAIVSSLVNVHHVRNTALLRGDTTVDPLTIPSLDPPVVRPGDPPLVVLESKPDYQMADGLPLMLWDCEYAEGDVAWHTDLADEGGQANVSGNGADLNFHTHALAARSAIYQTVNDHFALAVDQFHKPGLEVFPLTAQERERLLGGKQTEPIDTSVQTHRNSLVNKPMGGVLSFPLGGGTFKRTSKYIPMLQRKRLDTVAVANERWRVGKGSTKVQKKKGPHAVNM